MSFSKLRPKTGSEFKLRSGLAWISGDEIMDGARHSGDTRFARQGNMMKVVLLLVSLWLPSISIAQQPPAVAPDLLITAYKLGPIMRTDISRSNDFPELERQGASSSLEISPPNYQSQVKPWIKVRNMGSRTIKGVGYEFLLLEGPVPTTRFTALTIHVKKVIRPGDTVKISKLIRAAGNLKTWRQLQKNRLLEVRANIIRIEYADGSIWNRGPLMAPLK